MTTSPHSDSGSVRRTDTRATRSVTRDTRRRPGEVDARSPGRDHPSRRGFLRSLGAGAVALGTAGAVPGASAQSSAEPRIEGIDDWTLTEERIAADEVQDGPSVTYEDDAVVVTGSTTFSDGCGTFRVRRLFHVSGTPRLGVVIGTGRTDTSEVCTQALEPTRYELRVAASGSVEETVVDEVFTDAGPSHHPRTDEVDGIGELPPEVSDYELEWGGDIEGARSIVDAVERRQRPAVRFDGADVVVEGVVSYAGSTCNEFGLAALARVHDVEGHVGVEVEPQRRASHVPGDACSEDLVTVPYRLRLVGSGEPPIERCSVRTRSRNGNHSMTLEERDDDLQLPGGVTDHKLLIEQSRAYDDVEAAIRAAPTVTLESSSDGDVVAIEGTMQVGSSSCRTIGVEGVSLGGDGSTSELDVDVAAVDRERTEEADSCTADVVTADYRLELTVGEVPDAATVTERDDYPDQSERSATVELDADGDDGPELPPGVVDFSASVEQQVSSERVESPPSIATTTPSPGAGSSSVQIDGALVVGPCESFEVTDVRWEDDEQTHLGVTVDAVADEGMLNEDGECLANAPAVRTGYTVELELETLPDFVTAEEQLDEDGEPLRSSTTGVGACPVARSVEGQSVCNVDGDGLFMDVNGDGAVDNVDVVEFFRVQHREAWKQPELFDFSGNDSVGHGDVVALFEHVSSQL